MKKVPKKPDAIKFYMEKKSEILNPPLYSQKQYHHQNNNKLAWWHLLFILVACIGLTELMVILFNCSNLNSNSFINLRQYPKVEYKHVEQTPFPSMTWPNQTNVYHVTKEFGPATLGGLGVLLTALTKEQQLTGHINTNVILPYYSFLRPKRKSSSNQSSSSSLLIPSSPSSSSSSSSSSSLKSSKHTSSYLSKSSPSTMSFHHPTYTIEHEEDDWVPIEFSVYKWKYIIKEPPPIKNYKTWYIDDLGKKRVLKAGKKRPALKNEYIYVYLIGPGHQHPFNLAFKSDEVTNLYNTDHELTYEWRDHFFSKATATFLSYQASKARHDQSLFAPSNDFISPSSGVDVVHIHGATNAYLAHYLKDPSLWNSALPEPAVVYTLHDYLDEFLYSNHLQSIQKFDPNPPLIPISKNKKDQFIIKNNNRKNQQQQQPYSYYPLNNNFTIYENRLYTSSLGIDLADIVTFVSKSMVIDMTNGDMDIHLKELAMENILRKVEKNQFFGISNGVDYHRINPFKNEKLLKAKIAYPKYAWKQISSNEHHLNQLSTSSESSFIPYTLSDNINHDHVMSHKKRAKRWLVRNQLLSTKDLERPLVLFIGRYQYNKGLESFERAIQAFKQQNMKLVMFGIPFDYPLEEILSWEQTYPDHVQIFTTNIEQEKWMIYFRAAADFVFVPSKTESFGLVAAEGLVFGARVISTGVGGLNEFLKDRPSLSSSPSPSPFKNENKKKNIKKFIPVKQFMSQSYNSYLYQLNKSKDHEQSLEMAIQHAANDYYYLQRFRLQKEQVILHSIDTALDLGWKKPHHELTGPIYDYFRVYDLAIQYQYNQSHPMINKNPNLF
ncbi:unnamed protein product [Cunninghamella blakesleeana]